ncbi:MAG: iron-sulfur cluster repair di-iron protein [Salibacteraceae bacterium]
MQDLKEHTVAQIVTKNIKTADVFKKYGIDFCCGGNVNLAKVCDRKGVNLQDIETDLEKSFSTSTSSHDYASWDLGFLIDFIVNTHHQYVVNNVGLMLQYTNRVAEVHGNGHPEVIRINQLAHALVNELQPHLQKEEQILFPHIKKLVGLKSEGKKIEQKFVESPIAVMHQEHDAAGDIIKEIAQLSNNFTPPEGACNTYRAMYSKLEEFQNDLFQHIHLENNILFPKAILLEEELSL